MSKKSDGNNDSRSETETALQSAENEEIVMSEPNKPKPSETPPHVESAMGEATVDHPIELPPTDTESSSVDEVDSDQPTELPPSLADREAAVGEPTQYTGKKITALWSSDHNRNSWVYVAGLGWKKLADNSNSGVVALTTLGAHAKQTDAMVNLLEEGGKITQMDVW